MNPVHVAIVMNDEIDAILKRLEGSTLGESWKHGGPGGPWDAAFTTAAAMVQGVRRVLAGPALSTEASMEWARTNDLENRLVKMKPSWFASDPQDYQGQAFPPKCWQPPAPTGDPLRLTPAQATAVMALYDELDRIAEVTRKLHTIQLLGTVEFADKPEAEAFYGRYFPNVKLEWREPTFNRITHRRIQAATSGPLKLVTCIVPA